MRITRKMKRELKQAVNPLEELLIIIKQYFSKLITWIDNLTDTRNQSYITYDLKVCLLTQILAFCSSYQSMISNYSICSYHSQFIKLWRYIN